MFPNFCLRRISLGNSPAVQWLGFRASTEGGAGSIPGRGTKILQATRRGDKKKQTNISLGGHRKF